MKNKCSLLFALGFLICIYGYSQDTIKYRNHHSFFYEPAIIWLKEKILIPKVHKGVINSITYRYQRIGKYYHELFFNIGYGMLKEKLETERVTQNGQIHIGYSFGYNLLKKGKVRYFLGINTLYKWSIMEFPVWDESRAYWGTTISAGLFNLLLISFPRNQTWLTSWDISLTGWVSRPDEIRLYAQEDWSFLEIVQTTNSHFQFGFVNKILISCLHSEYWLPLSKGLFMSLKYSIQYSRIMKRNGQPLLITQNNLGIGLVF